MKLSHANIKFQLSKKQFVLLGGLLVIIVAAVSLAAVFSPRPHNTISAILPRAGSQISGKQLFQATVANRPTDSYAMYWAVDNGPLHLMADSPQHLELKQSAIDVTGWKWRYSGYKLTYVAKAKSGAVIATATIAVSIPAHAVATAAPQTNSAKPSAAAPLAPAAAAGIPVPGVSAVSQPVATASVLRPFAGAKFYVDPSSNARLTADIWRASRPDDARQMDKLAIQPQARWFGDWNSTIAADVSSYVGAATAQAAIPTLVAYNIPHRDCGGYSAGGTTADSYLTWVKGMASGIGSRRAIVILEPDALAGIGCLSAADQSARYNLLTQAVTSLKANPQTFVYIDGGNARWQAAATMAARLKQAGITAADGFSLNVSNFFTTTENVVYGKAIADQVAQKHFVVDTSRNGAGPTADNQWCNPAGRALGQAPTGDTGQAIVDAYLWVKIPGDSDGSCNGGPAAGSWWPDYALGLAQRS